MFSLRPIMFSLVLALFGTGFASADVLLIDSISSLSAVQTPRTGTTMTAVRQQYGAPMAEQPTVSASGGPQQPPINQWDYSNFSVVFERDRVIHSVARRASTK